MMTRPNHPPRVPRTRPDRAPPPAPYLPENPVKLLRRAAFLLFMVFGIPALIMLPFVLSGFAGRP